MYRKHPFTLSANMAIGLLLAVVLWRLAPQRLLMGWLLADLLLTLTGIADCRRFRPALISADPACLIKALSHLHFVFSGSGVFWGAAA